MGTPKRRTFRRFFISGNSAVCQPHATPLQNPEVRADAGLCEQAHHLAIPSLRSLRFPVGTPKSRSNGSFSLQGIVLFANRTQLRCRTPTFGLTLDFVCKLTASLFRLFVPYDSLWERQNDGHSVVFSFQGIVLSHATLLQNPEVRADALLCEQAHRLAIPSLCSLRFPVGTPLTVFFITKKAVFCFIR